MIKLLLILDVISNVISKYCVLRSNGDKRIMFFLRQLKEVIGLLIYKIAPIKNNRFVFQSYHGHFCDSPRMIYEYIKETNPQIETIWILSKDYVDRIPDGQKYVLAGSIKSRWISGSAQVLIDNVYCDKEYTVYSDILGSKLKAKIIGFLKDKRKQLAFTTLHGTPVKTIDRDVVNSKVVDFVCPGTEIILGNQFAVNIHKHVTFGKMPVHLIGFPRNDVLFLENARCDIVRKLRLDEKKKYILYAPTFRNEGRDTAGRNVRRSGLEQIDEMDFNKLFSLLSKTFGGDWSIILRFHQHVSKMVDWDKLNQKYNNRFVNGNQSDEMSDYLVVSDALITDYSSSMFDYILTGKPCFIYANDLDYFIKHERGLYVSLDQLPFPYAEKFDELLRCISDFNIDMYKKQVSLMIKEFGFVDDNNSTQRVSEYILERASINKVRNSTFYKTGKIS